MFSLDLLREKAYELGLDALAITHPEPFQEMASILKDRQTRGLYPNFVAEDIELRVDPRKTMPQVRSIISVGIAYKTVEPGPIPHLHGLLSRYAWGVDYHRVLPDRMAKLGQFLQEEFGAQTIYFSTDTGPLIDRAIAVRASLGYTGQNCAVFVPPYGSWIFLGEILIDLELPPTTTPLGSQPQDCRAQDKCGQCVKACPTGALFAPYHCNPHICISYLTQMSGMIPIEWRNKIGKKLWGCDICQMVCSVNQTARPSRHPEFHPLEGTTVPLIPLLSLSNREFKERFGTTALNWRGKKTLQRNAAIILGNYKDPEAIPALSHALQDPKEVVRASSAWALGEIGTGRALDALTKAQLNEKHELVLEEITQALAKN